MLLNFIMEKLKVLVAKLGTKVGIYSYNYQNQKVFALNEHQEFVAASSIKVFLLDMFLDYLLTNKIDLFSLRELNLEDRVEDSPWFDEFIKSNNHASYLDILHSMITVSDNTSTNIIIDLLGFHNISRYLNLLYPSTKINRKMCDFESRSKGIDNFTTPFEMFKFFDSIYDFNELDIYTDLKKYNYTKLNWKNKYDTLMKIISEQKDLEKIPSGIEDKNTLILNKPGELDKIRNDSGIILSSDNNIFISIFAEGIFEEDISDFLLAEITKELFNHLRS